MKSFLLRLVALLVALVASPAFATTVGFTYSGSGTSGFSGYTATGSGSFVTDDLNNPAGLANVTAFSFTLKVIGDGDADVYSYGLGDLSSFAATFTGSSLTDLSLETVALPATYNYFQAFSVAGLGVGEATAGNVDTGPIVQGTLALDASTVPEPGTLVLASLALLGLGAIGGAGQRRAAG